VHAEHDSVLPIVLSVCPSSAGIEFNKNGHVTVFNDQVRLSL